MNIQKRCEAISSAHNSNRSRPTKMPVICGHEVAHSLAQTRVFGWRALRVAREIHISYSVVKFLDDGVPWRPRR
jgi:hypothetical protein